MRKVDIYLGDRYYGTISIKFYPPPFTTKEEELQSEVESRLPLLKRKQYTIVL